MGDGNERTGDENSSRRERPERADGRSNPDHRKGSASRGEDILQGRGRHNGARIHLALERVLMIAPTDARFQGCAYVINAEAFNAWPCRHHAGRWSQTPNLPDGA
jgi:hypothetical protein